MAPAPATVREFIRRIYRDGGANSTTRAAYLDGLADTALNAQQKGKMLSMSSDKGTAVQYAAFAGWSPQDILALIDDVRGLISYSTVAEAIEAFDGRPVKGIATTRRICRFYSGISSLS